MKGYRCKLSCIVVDVNQTFPYIILFELASMLDGLWEKYEGGGESDFGYFSKSLQSTKNRRVLELESGVYTSVKPPK